MYKKKILFILFAFIYLFSGSAGRVYAEDVPEIKPSHITSDMYGNSYKAPISFNSEVCQADYLRLNVEVAATSIEEYEAKDAEGFKGLYGKFMNIINQAFYASSMTLNQLIFSVGCGLGFAPSQLLQMMFIPVNLDQYNYLDAMATSIQTIAIVTLAITSVMSILEIRKMDGSIGQEIIQKIGFVLVSVAIIASSKFLLQGIYDIANVLGYYVSHYRVDIQIIGKKGEVGVNLLEVPSVFASYLDYAYKPDVLKALTGFNSLMLGILSIVKIIILIFMTKDLMKIAVYGLKRLVTLVSAPILLPILGALFPSMKTRDIFGQYFKTVIASAFAPVLFGLIYLGSAPFVLEDLTTLVEAPLLKIVLLAFYINILSSIPQMVDGLIGSANPITNERFQRGIEHSKFGTIGRATANIRGSFGGVKSNVQGINSAQRTLNNKNPDNRVGWRDAGKKYFAERAKYGTRIK